MKSRWMVCMFGMLLGCSSDGGSSAPPSVTPGLWIGGSPATNTDGDPFDTGWAICFYVNADGTALTPSTECDIDGDDDEAHLLEVSWKEDVSVNNFPAPCSGAIGVSTVRLLDEVPIDESSFFFRGGTGLSVENYLIDGTFNGDTATGTARWYTPPELGGSFCELDGGWTAAPAP